MGTQCAASWEALKAGKVLDCQHRKTHYKDCPFFYRRPSNSFSLLWVAWNSTQQQRPLPLHTLNANVLNQNTHSVNKRTQAKNRAEAFSCGCWPQGKACWDRENSWRHFLQLCFLLSNRERRERDESVPELDSACWLRLISIHAALPFAGH